jgi:peroxiredoxin
MPLGSTMITKHSNIIFFCFLLIANISFAQNDTVFTIKGKINGLIADKWVSLQNIEYEHISIDSIKTINGEFIFSGFIKTPTLYKLKVGKSAKESFSFFVEKGVINLDCENKYPFGCDVKGSYNQHLVDEFAIQEKLAWNPEVIENLKNTYSNYNEKAGYIRKQKFSSTIRSFSQLHSSDRAIPYLASINSNYIFDEDLAFIYQNFSKSLKKSIFAQEILADINMRNATKMGKKLSDLKQKDLNGEKVSLWDFHGKYVLLYFWASGFEPCRTENLKLKKVYDKYKDWDFEVMAVSLDSVENDWNRAVLEDNLSWQNLSDLKGWDNEIARKLNIQAIPFTILLGREGEIIGKDLQAEELDNILNLIRATRESMPKKEKKKAKQNPKKKKTKTGALPGATN